MGILKDNLPWAAPTLAILAVGAVYLNNEGAFQFGLNQDVPVVAASVESLASSQALINAVEAATTAPSTSEQLSAIAQEAEFAIAPDVTRTTSLTTAIAPEAAPVEAPEIIAAVSPIGDDPAAFFASAQANLAATSSCGDDLRALAAEARIYFPSGGLAGGNAGLSQARLIGQVLGDCPGFRIQVEGHSDPSGDPAINLRLSQQRADSVVARLAASGLNTDNFVAKGMGDIFPSNVSGKEPDAYYDRRVEFTVIEDTDPALFASAPNQWQSGDCALKLESILEQTKVFYAPGSITAPTTDLASVFNLASDVSNCAGVRLRVVGQHADNLGARETAATGRLRALAIMNTLVNAGFNVDQVLIGSPSWSQNIPGQPGLPNSRVDFQLVVEES